MRTRATRGPRFAVGDRTIRGRVSGPTGEPLVCAQVHISPDSDSYVHTDAEGRYSLNGLPAGSFVVQAYMPGYLSLRHGQRHQSDEEKAVALKEGERRDGVDITLLREAMVTGTVVDEHGEPVEGVPVSAIQLRRRNGRAIGATRAIARATDDRGQYRIIAVPPGSYLIGASATGDLITGNVAGGYVRATTPARPISSSQVPSSSTRARN